MAIDASGYPVIPHELAGGRDCDGCLQVVISGETATLACNICATVVAIVPATEAIATLERIGAETMCRASCPHCGAINTFFGFTSMHAFICQSCRQGVEVAPQLR